MKKINLNLSLGKLELLSSDPLAGKSDKEIVVVHIEIAIQLYQQQERGLLISDHRKIYKILDAVNEALKKGPDKDKNIFVELEDDWFDFLYNIFQKVKFQGGTRILVKISDELERVKTAK